jgi:hypothetical protein
MVMRTSFFARFFLGSSPANLPCDAGLLVDILLGKLIITQD